MKSDKKYVELIEICKILANNGIDLKKIRITKKVDKKIEYLSLKEIEQNGIDINKIIEENNLDGNYPLSKLIREIRAMYNGSSYCKVSVSLLEEAEEIGIIKNESVIQEGIRICKILSENGVRFKKLQISNNKEGKNSFILLKEIKQEGIDINRIIEENNLNPDYDIGKKIDDIRKVYTGARRGSMTNEEKQTAEKIEIVKKESLSQETIRYCRTLIKNNIDINHIPLYTKIGDEEKKWTVLGDFKKYGVDIDKICQENDLDINFVFGYRLSRLRSLYNESIQGKLTKSERKEVEELNIVKIKENKNFDELNTNEKVRELRKICNKYGISYEEISDYMKNENISQDDIKYNSQKRNLLISEIMKMTNKKEHDINVEKFNKNQKDKTNNNEQYE